MNRIIFSIIIPHRNTPNLLIKCIQSILNHEDIQIIIIDDNSDIEVLQLNIWDELTKISEIIYLKEQKGAGFARNIGLERAKGKWLLFADADDYFVEDMYSILNKYREKDFDIIFFALCKKLNNAPQGKYYANLVERYNENDLGSIENLKYRTWAPWAKLYKAEYIKKFKIKFEERIIGNDCYFVLTANKNTNNIFVDKTPLYCHIHNINGLSNSHSKNWTYELDRLKLTIWRNKFYNSINHNDWQGKGIYSYLISIYRKFGFWKFLTGFFIAICYTADFITPIKNSLKKPDTNSN